MLKSAFRRLIKPYLRVIDSALANKTNQADIDWSHVFLDLAKIQDWKNWAGSGERTVGADGVLKVGNNSGNDQAWMIHNRNIPIKDGVVYKIKVRIKNLGGRFYVGIAGVASDGETLVNLSGKNSHGGQHYVFYTDDKHDDFVIIEGYFATIGTTFPTGLTNLKTLRADIRFVRPLVLVNYATKSGICYVDWYSINRVN